MSEVLSPAAARRTFLLLTLTRWFPVGLVVGVITLWVLERGLTISQALLAFSLQGIVIFVLELPTSGFADAFGRRPMLIISAVVNVIAGVVMIVADSFWSFVVAAALQGVFRALDSGPLEAWYVDSVHATEPGADVDGTLAAQGTALGVSMAIGAVISGGLIAWDPLSGPSALLLPMLCWASLNVLHLVAVVVLMKEARTHVDASGLRRAAASAREAPAVVRDGLGLLRGNRVLRCVVLVEVFWTAAVVVVETFQPIRLAELVGGEEQAGALMGPVAAVGWGVFAAGSALAGLGSRRFGVARTAIAARVLNGLGAVVMGVAAGPVALIAAYLFTYSMHGTGEPMHAALLHREASAANRATVLSMGSMVFFATFSLLGTPLGLLAEASSTQVAMVTAGAFSVLGAFLYLPALRAEQRRPAPAGEPAPAPGT
ncbi:MFS transporter [Nocardioides euryhalodurans]|uniref:MFS transporter n=1 Tax=Nocardioides euryhalodurans TaxID=2518370 RepID=A0A4P7GNX8_9ACTN|nr:MFS transporter [Nocardioides euryhalodurans]QBR93936.1 MFS transporter [Nocardioides euryhalodurans]